MAGDDVVCHAVGDSGVDCAGYEIEEGVIDCVEVFAMLVAIVQTSASDLRELTGAIEALWRERIGWVVINAPVSAC